MAPAGVVAHSSPPAGVAAHSSPFVLSPQFFPFFRDAIFVNALPVDEMGFVMGFPEQVQYTMLDGHMSKAVWRIGGTCR